MTTLENHIQFTLIDDEQEYVETLTIQNTGTSWLRNEKIYLEDFGECRGMGRCGTCVVEVIK